MLQPETTPSFPPTLQPPCLDYQGNIVFLEGSDPLGDGAVLADVLVEEANPQAPLSAAQLRDEAVAATQAVKKIPGRASNQEEVLATIYASAELAENGEVAENVIAMKGCEWCVKSGTCALLKRLKEHQEVAIDSIANLRTIRDAKLFQVQAQKWAQNYGKIRESERRREGRGLGAKQSLGELLFQNSLRGGFRDMLVGIKSENMRDAMVERIYKERPAGDKEDLKRFMDGLVVEIFVFEQLTNIAKQAGWTVEFAAGQQDIEEGTDIIVRSSDKKGNTYEVRVDAKSRGHFFSSVKNEMIRATDAQSYFGVKINSQGDEVLVVNPEGQHDGVSAFGGKTKVAKVHSFAHTSKNGNVFMKKMYNQVAKSFVPTNNKDAMVTSR